MKLFWEEKKIYCNTSNYLWIKKGGKVFLNIKTNTNAKKTVKLLILTRIQIKIETEIVYKL